MGFETRRWRIRNLESRSSRPAKPRADNPQPHSVAVDPPVRQHNCLPSLRSSACYNSSTAVDVLRDVAGFLVRQLPPASTFGLRTDPGNLCLGVFDVPFPNEG
jgi:hypothetical protein